jgi:hypothetical protein
MPVPYSTQSPERTSAAASAAEMRFARVRSRSPDTTDDIDRLLAYSGDARVRRYTTNPWSTTQVDNFLAVAVDGDSGSDLLSTGHIPAINVGQLPQPSSTSPTMESGDTFTFMTVVLSPISNFPVDKPGTVSS